MGNWDEVNQKIQELWYGFWDIVGEVITAIWEVVVTIVTVILPAVLIVVGGIVGVTAIIALFSPAIAIAFISTVVEIGAGLVLLASEIAIGVVDFALLAIEAGITLFATLIEGINLTAILELHTILWVLSDDYRQLIGLLFDEISKVSEALFGSGMVLHLIFRSTRSLILSVSSLLGRPYDISQISWLVTFEDILNKFNERAELYMNDPEQLFFDLEEWAEKNAIDVGGTLRQDELLAQGIALEFIKTTALKLKETDDSYRQFAFALPGNRGRAIREETDPINFRLGKFQFSTYERDRLETGEMVNENRRQQDFSRQRLRSIEYETDRPSRGFSKIDKLPPDEREGEEIAVEEYATRELERDNEELVKQHEETIEKEEAEKVKKEIYLAPPSWQTVQEQKVSVLAMSKSRSRNTPFVGDY